MTKKIYVLGGGTVFHVRPHLALSAPAYGSVANKIFHELETRLTEKSSKLETMVPILGLTKMANPNRRTETYIGETNNDVEQYLDAIVSDPDTKMIFMSVALCDYEGQIMDENGKPTLSGKGEARLKTAEDALPIMRLKPAEKLIGKIRRTRKDIFLVAFKTTAGATEEEQYQTGLALLKKNSCNLVVANDIQTGLNMIIAPELAAYHVTHDRSILVHNLVEMALLRSTNEFARTTVEQTGEFLPWGKTQSIPPALQKVVDWCVEAGAYKPFNDVTVGHFGFRPNTEDGSILWSSRRKQNFNRQECRDLVKVKFSKEKQIAYGAKPSAGARSQFIVLSKYKELNCIVHFHCAKKANSLVPVRSQREFECGSHQCGKNTADGMSKVNDQLAAVMLDKHGPNIVFAENADPQMVIDFIKNNFMIDLQTR